MIRTVYIVTVVNRRETSEHFFFHLLQGFYFVSECFFNPVDLSEEAFGKV